MVSTSMQQRHQHKRCADLVEDGHLGKGRDGSRNSGGGNDRHGSDHGKAAVVELLVPLGGELVGTDVGAHVDSGEDNLREGSSLGVVDFLRLGGDLGNEGGEEDLGLAGIRDGSPGLEGLHGREGLEGGSVGEVTREVDSVGLDEEANEGNHGNTGVLELGGTEPGKSLVGSRGGQAEGVEGLDGHGASVHIIKSIEGRRGLTNVP